MLINCLLIDNAGLIIQKNAISAKETHEKNLDYRQRHARYFHRI